MIHICTGDHDASVSAWLARYRTCQPSFACILSFTDTGLIPEISAAGMTPDARRYTALADGEFLAGSQLRGKLPGCPPDGQPDGQPRSRYSLPTLIAGISPALITRAVLSHQDIPLYLFSTGLPDALTVPHTPLPNVMAKAVNTGQAMTQRQTALLLESGFYWGQRLAQPNRYLIVGECVVGGTTTAQAVLTALGYDTNGRMSSSHRQGNHPQKQTLVNQGIDKWRQGGDRSPLAAVAAMGDPMQVVAAGIALAASQQGGVLLAGGSQMLAVYALANAIARHQNIAWHRKQVVVGTTRWIVEDISADTVAIAKAIGAPYLASQINFSQSPYFQLRAYEQGFVKEGVGAGGCAIAAHLYRGWTQSQLRHAVEAELRRCL